MAGALWTSYDASFPAIWVEAMKRRSRAGGEPVMSNCIQIRPLFACKSGPADADVMQFELKVLDDLRPY